MNHEAPVFGTKTCGGECGRELPVLAFAANAKTSDGLKFRCRDCEAAYDRWRLAPKRKSRTNTYDCLG